VVQANREELIAGKSIPLTALLSRLVNSPEEDPTSDTMDIGESPLRPIVLQGAPLLTFRGFDLFVHTGVDQRRNSGVGPSFLQPHSANKTPLEGPAFFQKKTRAYPGCLVSPTRPTVNACAGLAEHRPVTLVLGWPQPHTINHIHLCDDAGYRLVQEALDAAEGAKEMLEEIGGDKLKRVLTAGHALNSIRSLYEPND
jgi:hypothetical protein